MTGAPPAKDEEVMNANTTQFVSVPLDILMKYFARAKRVTMQLPSAKRLAGQGHRRGQNGNGFPSRESTRTLGAVVKETYEARDAHWVTTTVQDNMHPAATASGPSGAESDWQGSGQNHEGWHDFVSGLPAGQLQSQRRGLPKRRASMWRGDTWAEDMQFGQPWRLCLHGQNKVLKVP